MPLPVEDRDRDLLRHSDLKRRHSPINKQRKQLGRMVHPLRIDRVRLDHPERRILPAQSSSRR
jgi:hypothetical protein